MKKSDVKIGMKVVPFRKTVPGYKGLEQSYLWKIAKGSDRPYMFVIAREEEEKCWILNYDERGTTGDFFRASDFRPYKDDK